MPNAGKAQCSIRAQIPTRAESQLRARRWRLGVGVCVAANMCMR